MWNNKKDLAKSVITYIKEYGSVISLHGIVHIVHPNRHGLEILFWFLTTFIAAVGALTILADNWQRYNSNPTVINLEKNFRSWKVEFPSATLCPYDRVDVGKAKQYIQRTWGTKEESEKFNYYMAFINSVSNLTYDNLEDFKEFANDPTLTSVDLVELSLKVLRKLTYISLIFDPRYKYISLKETITEMGICYTYSGVATDYISLRKIVQYDPATQFQPPYCNFLDSLCYSRIEELEGSFKFYVHSPFGFPDISNTFFPINAGNERYISLKASTTVAADALRRLTPKQRRCQFMDEPTEDMDSPVYNYNLCKMNCRKRFALEKCNCYPYFYGKSSSDQVCGVHGLSCLVNFTEEIKTLTYANKKPFPCSCPQLCQLTDFILINELLRSWSFDTDKINANFRWGIEVYSKTRYRRDVIFAFEDLLVSFGGTVAFFLGCSVITCVELFYFFTLRLFWFMNSVFKQQEQTQISVLDESKF